MGLGQMNSLPLGLRWCRRGCRGPSDTSGQSQKTLGPVAMMGRQKQSG